MRKASIAEWILSLATSPERAAAIVGDLIERSSGLWIAVLRTFLSLLGEGLLTGRTAWLALCAFAAQILLPVPLLLLLLRPSFVIGHTAMWMASALCLQTIAQFLIGWWLARRSRGKELAACCALGILNCVVGAMNVHTVSVNMAIWQIPVILAVVIARRRSLWCA